jgi:hypothetical protein
MATKKSYISWMEKVKSIKRKIKQNNLLLTAQPCENNLGTETGRKSKSES